MDQDTKKKYDSLPKDIKNAIDSNDIFTKVQAIGKKHLLHIDKVDALANAIGSVMLGYVHPDDFVDVVESDVGVNTQEAIQIATEVNVEVFIPIRSSLMKMYAEPENPVRNEVSKPQFGNMINPSKPAPTPSFNTTKLSEAIKKTNILGEIENPSPSVPMIPVKKEPEIEIKRGPQKPWESAKNEIAQNFITSKLSSPMSMPTQRTELQEKKPPAPMIQPKNSGSDPYRENLI